MKQRITRWNKRDALILTPCWIGNTLTWLDLSWTRNNSLLKINKKNIISCNPQSYILKIMDFVNNKKNIIVKLWH